MKTFKRLFILLLVLLFIPSKVSAETINNNYPSYFKFIGITEEVFHIKSIDYGPERFWFHVVTENGTKDIAYCLHMNKEAANTSGSISARDYIVDSNGNRLSDAQVELLKNILASGYQKDQYLDRLITSTRTDSYDASTINTANHIFATQILIWEVLENVRTGYTNSSTDYRATNSDNSLNFVNKNGKLKEYYNNILNKAKTLASGSKPQAFGQTFVMHWVDNKNYYIKNNINVSSYSIGTYDRNKIDSVSKDGNNVLTITTTKQISTPEKINFTYTQGSTLSSANTMRIFIFSGGSSAMQHLILSTYRKTVTGDLSVKTESGKFKITKQDSTTKKNIKGAVFDLYKCNSNNSCTSKVTTIDMKNTAVSSDITINKSGKYLLRETIAPVGYDKIGDITMTLTIDDSGKVTASNVNPNSKVAVDRNSSTLNLVLYNDQKVFYIKKKDGNTNSVVNGATFQIKKLDGTVVKFKKDKEGKYIYDETGTETSLVSSSLSTYSISLLPVGEYILEEINVPGDYVLPSSVEERQTKFKIDASSFLMTYNYSTKKYDKDTDVTIEVKNFKTRIAIHKTGLKNADIEGVIFELYDSNKQNLIPLTIVNGEYRYSTSGTVRQLVTNSKGYIYINSLVSGTYYLKEVSTPEGSGLVIDPNNQWTKLTVSVTRDSATKYNYVKEIRNAKGTFCFYKIDEDGNYLDSGKFKLQMYNTTTSKYEDKPLIYNKTDKTYSIDKDNTSDIYVFSPVSNKQTCFTDIDAKGKYRIVEIEAPEGFVLPSSSEATAEIEINEYGYASGDAVIINRKVRIGDDTSAQAELIINIQTGQNRIHYILIICSIVAIIGALIIVSRKIDKK